jgi:hypothetical protein
MHVAPRRRGAARAAARGAWRARLAQPARGPCPPPCLRLRTHAARAARRRRGQQLTPPTPPHRSYPTVAPVTAPLPTGYPGAPAPAPPGGPYGGPPAPGHAVVGMPVGGGGPVDLTNDKIGPLGITAWVLFAL